MSSVQSPGVSDGSTKRAVAGSVARFAGVMLGIVAVFQILEGIAAIANDDVFVRGVDYTYKLDVTAWGWIHLCLGVIALAISVAIITEHTLGYMGGIMVAMLGALTNFAFLPHYPLWAVIVISFNVLVIWALCVQIDRGRVDLDYYAHQDTTGGGSRSSSPSFPPSMPR